MSPDTSIVQDLSKAYNLKEDSKKGQSKRKPRMLYPMIGRDESDYLFSHFTTDLVSDVYHPVAANYTSVSCCSKEKITAVTCIPKEIRLVKVKKMHAKKFISSNPSDRHVGVLKSKTTFHFKKKNVSPIKSATFYIFPFRFTL